MRRLLIAIIALASLGVAVSSYGLWQHYAPSGSSFCNFSATVSCDLVNQSTYSEIFGIPVAGIGILGYLAIAVLGVIALAQSKWTRDALRVLGALVILGALFQLVFTYIELFIIKVICPVCIASQIIIIIIFVLTVFALRRVDADV